MASEIAQNRTQSSRIGSLIRRTATDLSLSLKSAIFALKNMKGNGLLKPFIFRRSIEISHISPFRKIFKKPITTAKLTLPHFGGAHLKFDFQDPFQMAVCEEFVKFGIYDMGLVTFQPQRVIDGGAYRGCFSYLVKNRFPDARLVCIEPHPVNYKELQASFKENSIRDFEVLNYALAGMKDHIVLELWGSNMARTDQRTNTAEYINVPAIDLTEMIKQLPKDESLLLKVDIEGSELDFFPKCIEYLPKTCAVFLETHDGWQSLPEIKASFEKHGFTFTVIRARDLYIDSFAIRK